ncbi:right-handed parallel beta-helix repeat-containing protein [Blastococcus sp. TF02A-30]|uniref:right-handed parallel beta-helix repeat-containing protein n=1 Tax=Blastococcus sp. TF02A-30 TaxID=2250580 RepID=UPI000DE9B65B|nr:right-handed parallel beta-helix repeat-containing protein [Blastococcus sp. TF02A-30]RBY89600.1 hypothetical protein DQ241_09190 [Blastococcus sp. TF02A-30]
MTGPHPDLPALGRRGFVAALVGGAAAGAATGAGVARLSAPDVTLTEGPPVGATVLAGRGIDPTGTDDSTTALQRLVDTAGEGAALWLPAGLYLVDGLVLAPGQSLAGPLARSYTGTAGHGARLRARTPGQREPVLTVGANGRLSDLTVSGNGRNQPAVRPGGFLVVVERVTMVEGSVGYDADYTSGNVLSDCQIHENGTGIANLVDSLVQTTAINANDGDGVALGPGANDNVFQGLKIEWNAGHGLQAFQAEHNLVVGGIVDRNGRTGLRFVECGHSAVVGSVLRRNGRLAQGSDDDCHIFQQDCTGLVVTGVVTNSGGDDDGGGYASPAVAVRRRGGRDLVLTGNDLTGRTGSAVDDDGSQTALLNAGVAGVQTASGTRVRVGTADLVVDPAASASAAFDLGPSSRDDAGTAYRLLVVARDRGSGARTAAEAVLLVSRDDGDAEVAVGALADRIGSGAAERFSLRATVSGNGGELAVTLGNAGAVPVQVRLELT